MPTVSQKHEPKLVFMENVLRSSAVTACVMLGGIQARLWYNIAEYKDEVTRVRYVVKARGGSKGRGDFPP